MPERIKIFESIDTLIDPLRPVIRETSEEHLLKKVGTKLGTNGSVEYPLTGQVIESSSKEYPIADPDTPHHDGNPSPDTNDK